MIMAPILAVSNKVIGETVFNVAIKKSCDDIIALLGHLVEKYDNFEERMEELDLDNYIRIVGLYLDTHCRDVKDKVILECIESLRVILEKIRDELRE